MISEPELAGEWDEGRLPEEARPDTVPDRVRGPRGAWWWALGGAVLASAVWAGVLAAQDRYADAPRIAYRHGDDLCEMPLTALSRTTVQLTGSSARQGEHPVLDWSYCGYHTPYVEGALSYQAEVAVQLHKKADPRTEFGASPAGGAGIVEMADSGVAAEQVPGLGERALMNRRTQGLRLQVLDGGAVFTLGVEWFGEDADSSPDVDAVQAAMIEDMRALMTALRT
ncbi:hypothetical protein AB0B01_18255 [Streptomyces sp. NPDC044571]|uniref:hypothetical protein n=1 Tax=Streptomyces sp. NPDC044571 TaxID=3155371 RepID=UPI0033F53BF2